MQPLFNQDLRAEALAALSCVDYVAVAKSGLGPDAIQSICPDIYVPWEENDPGNVDYRKVRETEAAIVRAVGGRFVALTSTGVKTVRLNHHGSPALAPDASEFLNAFRTRYSREDIAAALDKARTTSVLFVGETIIDEYQYCESIGKSGKEPVLAVRYVSEEKFAGGVLATANQSAAFCDRIGMLTLLGTKDSHEEFIREKLNPKIDDLLPVHGRGPHDPQAAAGRDLSLPEAVRGLFHGPGGAGGGQQGPVCPAPGAPAALRRGGRHRLRPWHDDAGDHRSALQAATASWR